MKKLIILCVLMLTATTTISAQQKNNSHNKDFKEFQIRTLIQELDIEGANQAKFRDTYTQYDQALQALRPKQKRNSPNMTNEQIDAQIQRSFKVSEQATALKREYYEQFKEILTPRQILRMYNIERQFNERISKEMQSRRKGDK